MGQTGPQVLREGKKFSVEFFRLEKTILPFPQLAQHDLRHPLGQSRGQRILSVTAINRGASGENEGKLVLRLLQIAFREVSGPDDGVKNGRLAGFPQNAASCLSRLERLSRVQQG